MKINTFDLIDGEAILDIYLLPTDAYKKVLESKGEKPPSPLKVPALIDSGCSAGVMISEEVIKDWRLKARGWSEVGFPRQEDSYYASYVWDVDIAVKFPKCSHDGGNVLIETCASMVELVHSENSKVIIGQGILQTAFFVYNGRKNHFSLTFPKPK
jgi:hypothetical protein